MAFDLINRVQLVWCLIKINLVLLVTGMAGNVVSQVIGFVCRGVVGCHKEPVMQLSCFISLLGNVTGIRNRAKNTTREPD